MAPSKLRDQAVSGGVSKDVIPAIDEPTFESVANADKHLDRGDIVFGIVHDGVTKAYPQSILVWHEVCNDVIGEMPISVTYCPLTGTAIGFERGETTFGVSGQLINNNLVMYDRSTERWWPQVLATAIPGWDTDAAIGQSLREFRVVWTSWGQWKHRFPNTQVLTENTGYIRDYGRDPYGSYNPRSGYYEPDSEPMFTPLSPNDRYPPKTVVIGVRTTEGTVAFVKQTLRQEGVLDGELVGIPHTAVYDPRLDTAYVYRNPDRVSLTPTDKGVQADGAVHAPDALPLEHVHTFDAMWFAWSGFYPGSSVYA